MSVQSKLYLKKFGDDWEYLGITSELAWDISSYDFEYLQVYQWRIDTYDTETELTTTGNTWWFCTEFPPLGFPVDLYQWPSDMWDGFDWDWYWNPFGDWDAYGGWESAGDIDDYKVITAGGGRWKKQLVVVGKNVVYVGDI